MSNHEIKNLQEVLWRAKEFIQKHSEKPFTSLSQYDDSEDLFVDFFEYITHEADAYEFSNLESNEKVFLAALLGLYDYGDNQEESQQPETQSLKNINQGFLDVNAYLTNESQTPLFESFYEAGIGFQPLLK